MMTKVSTLYVFTAMLCVASLMAPSMGARPKKMGVLADEGFSWLECEEFIDHIEAIGAVAGINFSPRSITGYSAKMCNMVFKHAKRSDGFIDTIVNLGTYAKGRKLTDFKFSDPLEDVASTRRSLQLASTCTHTFGQSTPGPLSPATAILECNQTCFLDPCIPSFLLATISVDSDGDQVGPLETYEEIVPVYGRGLGYDVSTAVLRASEIVNLWSGCNQDRTGPEEYADILDLETDARDWRKSEEKECEFQADDVEVPETCVDVPQPGRVLCAIYVAILKLIEVIFEALHEQADYQNRLVQAAEINAAWVHSENLLDKQCAIFDQVVCRCVEEEGTGQGCDGLDSNCNGEIDDCDEDTIAPVIDLTNSLSACVNGEWFTSEQDALDCIDRTISVEDDCHAISMTVNRTAGICNDSTITITATDYCNNTASAIIQVLIDDDGPPQVNCTILQGIEIIPSTEPTVYTDGELEVITSDACGNYMDNKINVTVQVYGNEIVDFDDFQMALFNENGTLFLATGIAETNNGKNRAKVADPKLPDGRVYTARVTAVDPAGLSSSNTCSLTVLRPNEKNQNPVLITLSNKRFHLTSYSTTQ